MTGVKCCSECETPAKAGGRFGHFIIRIHWFLPMGERGMGEI